jgi:hypothetical protein
MAKKIAKYALPRSEEALDTLTNSVLTYALPHIEGDNIDWIDIPPASWAAFKAAHAVWVSAYAACKGAHLPGDTEAKNVAEKELRDALSNLLNRGLLLEPRTEADAVKMGFHLLAHTYTVVTEVNDAVDIDSITNGPIPGSHVHVVRYRIDGHARRAKSPYHLAIFEVYIQGAGDPPPVLNSEKGWGKSFNCMNEPFELRHESGDQGKVAHYRAAWESKSGVIGPWSMASAEIP